jgi:capsular exopolysaccharide synthesis family protein
MSRLDEALRRSGPPHATEASGNAHSAQVFASPWTEPNNPDPRSAKAAAPVEEPRESPPQPASRLLDVPVRDLGASWKQWLVSQDVNPVIVEQFRKLAAALLHGQRDGRRLKLLMVTSAVPGEGKTLTSLNLALVLAESYRRRVLLIDADLRRPRLSAAANLTATEGLGDLLKAPNDRKAPLTQLTERLYLLPAGRPDPQPLSGLTSQRMQLLLEEAAERFDWVIVDTPPATVTADAGLIGALVDGTVLVVRAGSTRDTAVRQAIEALGRDRIFGVVLNGTNQSPQDHYYTTETP